MLLYNGGKFHLPSISITCFALWEGGGGGVESPSPHILNKHFIPIRNRVKQESMCSKRSILWYWGDRLICEVLLRNGFADAYDEEDFEQHFVVRKVWNDIVPGQRIVVMLCLQTALFYQKGGSYGWKNHSAPITKYA